MERKQVLTHIVLPAILGALFLFIISPYGMPTLFADFPNSKYPDNKIPNDVFLDNAKELDEVKLILSKYDIVHEGVARGQEPNLVVFTVLKSDVTGESRGNSSNREAKMDLILEMSHEGIPQNTTLFCRYGQDGTFDIDLFRVVGKDVLWYLQDLKEENCWDIPPPTYRDTTWSPRAPVNNSTQNLSD